MYRCTCYVLSGNIASQTNPLQICKNYGSVRLPLQDARLIPDHSCKTVKTQIWKICQV